MTLPAQRTVVGTYTNPVTGEAQTGSVIFSPSPSIWTDEDGNQLLLGRTEVDLVDGKFSQALVRTDAPGVLPVQGKTWRFTERIEGQPARTFYTEVSAGAGAVDITDLSPVGPAEPVADTTAGGDLTGTYPNPSLADTDLARDHLKAVHSRGDTMTGPLSFATGGVDVDTQEALSTALSTGVLSGGEVNVSATPNAIDVGALVGFFVDTFTDPFSPTATRVAFGAQTIALDAGSLTRSVTWFLMSADGTVTQQAGRPTGTQRRNLLVLGVIVYDPGTDTIFVDQSISTILVQPANQLVDLMDALGPFRTSGLRVDANGANLSLDLNAGQMFARGFSHFIGPTPTQDPHLVNVDAREQFVFRRTTRNFTGNEAQVTTVDPANFDDDGVLTPVGGGSGRATIQRLWMAGNGLVGNDIVVQYGQRVHATLTDAIESVGSGPFEIATGVETNAVLLAYIVMTRTATNLSDPAQAVLIRAQRFADA